MSTSSRSSGERPGFLLALLLVLSALVAVGVVVALEVMVGEWWAAVGVVGAAVVAWALSAVATYERPARRTAEPGGGVGLPGGPPHHAPSRRSRIA